MKSYLNEFKAKYGFLEEYGFILSIDPHNPDRLCYKNYFGEIVLSLISNAVYSSYEIYIQINGWKYEINLKEEYKKIFNKMVIFKPYHIMFKELFEFIVNKSKSFYGLSVLKNNYKPFEKMKYEDIDEDKLTTNIFKLKRRGTRLTVSIASIFISMVIQIGIMVGCGYINDYSIVSSLYVIIYALIFISHLTIVILLKDKFTILSKFYMVLHPIICGFLVCYLPNKVDMQIHIYMFIFTLVFILVNLILHFKVNKKYIYDAVIPAVYPTVIYIAKTIILENRIIHSNIDVTSTLILGLIIGLIGIIIYIVLKKDRKDKKEYIGILLAIFFTCFFSVWLVPVFTKQNINYAFDKSVAYVDKYEVVDKEIRHSGKGGRDYYIHILIDGKLEKVSVVRTLYNMYETGEYIELSYFEGYLDIDYYEYIWE